MNNSIVFLIFVKIKFMQESKDKYKASLIKFWKQSCDKPTLDIVFTDKSAFIKNKIVNLNITDDFIINTIDKAFKNQVETIFWDSLLFNSNCYYFDIDDKKLSISKLIVTLCINPKFKYNVEEKTMFVSTPKIVEKINNLQFFKDVEINNFIKTNSDNLVNYYRMNDVYYGSNNSKSRMTIYIPLLSYNNIYIPITNEEYEELRCYELESQRKKDMENVYRNLTLLSLSEYKEFIMWKESQRIIGENNTDMIEIIK